MADAGKIEDYYYLRRISEIEGISGKNRDYLEEWVFYERANSLTLNTINTDIAKMVSWLRDIGVDDAADVREKDILKAYARRMDRVSAGKYSDATLDVDVIVLRKFISWLHREADNVAGKIMTIKRKKHQNTRTIDEYITKEQIIKMRDYAASRGDVRGVAIIMLLFGTGCRLGELCNANVGDVKIWTTHAVITLDGKTGKRRAPFVVSLPEIQAWINCHPCKMSNGKADPEAPLFVTYNTRGHGNVRLSKKRVEGYIREMADAVGIPMNIKASPHAMRHLSATLNARDLTSAEMNAYYGWSASSQMPQTYVHTSEDALQQTILRQNNITQEEIIESSLIIQCPRCKTVNAAGSTYCNSCSMILTESVMTAYKSVEEDMGDSDLFEEYMKWKKAQSLQNQSTYGKK